MAANKFLGQYQNTKTENLDPYMRALGVNMILRKIGNSSSPQLLVEHLEGNHYKICEWTTLKTHTWDFTLGVEFKDKTVDGRHVLTTIDIVGETLVHTEKPADGKGKTPHYTWELLPDNNVKITYRITDEDVESTRIYQRVK